ncbi:pseudouridine synthase [Suttonella ornithocola]|uniref:pseudouridine synthase n=1 Tax=Suttonella ornithocola TaxID=279832 RepID=UPI000B31A690|nr:pseudouridine synthase [Suttonella ornithocola]
MDSSRVHFIEISANDSGQRVDNFIRKRYPALPKGRIYQMLRKGEVRLNKKRVKPTDKLSEGDQLRLPPIIDAERAPVGVPSFWKERIENAILYEDEDFLIINKPAGLSVHGGSGQSFGVIDVIRELRGEGSAELAHRLDKDTSGVLVLGKNRETLAGFQSLMQQGQVEKRYWALVNGAWNIDVQEVVLPLEKGKVRGNERMVAVSKEGQIARTFFLYTTQFFFSDFVGSGFGYGKDASNSGFCTSKRAWYCW